MQNTKILCPDCFKGRIFTDDGKLGICNQCSTKFTILNERSVRYYEKESEKPQK